METIRENSKPIVVGIVGTGKMGQDILQHLMDQEIGLVVVCRSEEKKEQLEARIGKQLRRKLKRGLLDEAGYEARLQAITVTQKFEDLSTCNLVIETVIEELAVKQETMRQIDAVVKDDCIIASNTSSIDLNVIYEGCKCKERCLGLHFFYPIRITNYVEINSTDLVLAEVQDRMKGILDALQIKYITLKNEGNMILSKIISTIVSYAIEIYKEGKIGYHEIDEIIKQDIMMFGAFELVDSTGFYIISKSLANFYDNFGNRYSKLYQVLEEEMDKVRKQGYLGDPQTGGFLTSEKEENSTADSGELAEYKQNVSDRMKAVILNDLAFYCNHGVANPEELFDAVYVILGLNKTPKEMFSEMGKENMTRILDKEFARTKQQVYSVEDYSCYGK